MNELIEMLRGGDLRSDGQANEVAEMVLEHPGLFDELFAGLWESDAVIRARPAAAKGGYIRAVTVSSTMGPGVKIEPTQFRKTA